MRHSRDLPFNNILMASSRARRRALLRAPLLDGNLKTWVRPGLPGSGATWTDTQGSNNVTIGNSMPWGYNARGLTPSPRGFGDFMTIGGSQIVATGTEAMWIYPTVLGTTDSQPVLMMSNGHYWAIQGNTGRLEFFNGAWRVASSGAVLLNTWHMVAIAHTTSDTKMYLDGIEVYSGAQTVSTGVATTYIGARSDIINSPYSFQGYISDVFFYNRMLSGSEIANLYALTK